MSTPTELRTVTAAEPHPTPVLVARGMTKRYRDVVALADVSITLDRGTSTAVVGPSGSGKSTLLHCLAGFTRPDDGEVNLDGMRISHLGPRTATKLRRERFGFVFQSDQLLAELPAVENVALPLMLSGMSRRAATARADEWFAPLSLDGLQLRRPGQLSGGQVQRVSIARALAVSPSVVFAVKLSCFAATAEPSAAGGSTVAVAADESGVVGASDPQAVSATVAVARMIRTFKRCIYRP